MDDYNSIVETISLAMGSAWASGINLYAAVLVLGILGRTENIILPESLEILMDPLVMGAAGVMFFVEFFADKVPAVDTGWDAIHTFIRIPAGAMLAAAAVWEATPALVIAAGILGGGIAAGTHAAKAGTRVIINASPEPVTNWTASFVEDFAVIGGLWAAMNYPLAFLGFLLLFLLVLIWILPKIWKGVLKMIDFIRRLFTGEKAQDPGLENAPGENNGKPPQA